MKTALRRAKVWCFYTLSAKLNIKCIAGNVKLLYNERATKLSALIFFAFKQILERFGLAAQRRSR